MISCGNAVSWIFYEKEIDISCRLNRYCHNRKASRHIFFLVQRLLSPGYKTCYLLQGNLYCFSRCIIRPC